MSDLRVQEAFSGVSSQVSDLSSRASAVRAFPQATDVAVDLQLLQCEVLFETRLLGRNYYEAR
jgi:hypothetical protein